MPIKGAKARKIMPCTAASVVPPKTFPNTITVRLIGATKSQVRAMIRTETLIMIAFGLTTGSLIAAPGLALLNRTLTGSLVPAVPLWSYLALLAFYAAVGLAATVLPTRWSLRANLVTATAYRE